MLCHVRGIFAMAAPDARGGYHVVAVDTSEIDTLKAAKQHVKLVDEGAGGRWKVDRHAPGDGVTRAGFVCNNHESCPVKLLIRRNDGMYCFLVKGEHSAELTGKQRSNSSMTWDDAAFTRTAMKTGAKPAEIVSALTDEALDSAKKKGVSHPKRPEGGLEGEVAQKAREYSRRVVHSCVHSTCILPVVRSVFPTRIYSMYILCTVTYILCIFHVHSYMHSGIFFLTNIFYSIFLTDSKEYMYIPTCISCIF